MKKIAPILALLLVLFVPSFAFADKIEVFFKGVPTKVKFSGGANGTIKVKNKSAVFNFHGKAPTKVCGVVNGSQVCKDLVANQHYQYF